jgi:DNA-binding MarR family transcriptional regulator
MVTEELNILNIVAETPDTSQRKIAEQTGLSLGQVNFLLKKFVRIGLIKIEGQTPKSLRYNLTPKGMAEKADKTLRYIKASYAAVLAHVDTVTALCEDAKMKGLQVYLVGSPDEMLEICKLACHRSGMPCKQGMPPAAPAVVFCWEEDVEQSCGDFPCVNVLKV